MKIAPGQSPDASAAATSPAAVGARPRSAWPLGAAQAMAASFPARRRRRAILIASDLALIAFAFAVAELSAEGTRAVGGSIAWMLLFGVLTMAIIAGRGGYRFRLGAHALDGPATMVTSTALALTVVITARVLVDPAPEAATQVVRWWGFAVVYLSAGRLAQSVYRARAEPAAIRTLIIGAGTVGRLVARRLGDRPALGLAPVGFLDKEPMAGEGELPVLGASWDLEDVVRRHDVQHVVVTFSRAPDSVLLGLVRRCRTLGVEVSLVPRLFEEVSNRVAVEHLGGVALLRIEQADPRGWQFDVKYALDRVVGVAATVLLSPVLTLLAVIVQVTSPGGVFFRQERVGLDGHVFHMLKFRTMRMGDPGAENDAAWAARVLGEEVAEAEEVAVEGPDRRTPIGRFLRRWSLDELPQVINVARGDMSLVGPRPERTGYVRAFEQHVYRYGDRHRVKSGLTGWAQVNGLRGETALEDRVEWDNYYIENWSPWLDLKILLMTPMAVVTGHGAQ